MKIFKKIKNQEKYTRPIFYQTCILIMNNTKYQAEKRLRGPTKGVKVHVLSHLSSRPAHLGRGPKGGPRYAERFYAETLLWSGLLDNHLSWAHHVWLNFVDPTSPYILHGLQVSTVISVGLQPNHSWPSHSNT